MPIFIHSEDYNSGGSSSDGIWTFSANLKGNWTVMAQQMETQNYAWLFTGQNNIEVVTYADDEMSPPVTFTVTIPASTGLKTNINNIATDFADTLTAAFQAVADDNSVPSYARTFTPVANNITHLITFTVSAVIDIGWSEANTTIGASIGKYGAPDDLSVTEFTISTANATLDPKYLEVHVAESNTIIYNAHGSLPSMMFSTRDGGFTGQSFQIPEDTNTLTIEITRMGAGQHPIPLQDQWYVVLEPV